MIESGAWLSRPIFNRNGIFFWFFGTVVKLRYPFFLMALVLGAGRRDVIGLLGFILVATAAVLLHELGHALAARRFGCSATIELHSFGGVTYWSGGDPSWRARTLIALAGPGIGFVFGGPLWAAMRLGWLATTSGFLSLLLHDLLFVTIGWGVFNLFPILPLDGGMALEAALHPRWGADRARYATRLVSCVVGGFTALVGLGTGMTWAGVLCVVFTYNNLMALRGLSGVRIVG
jgi:Zn-dependent protease